MAELTDVIGLSAMMDLSAFNKGMGTYNQGLAKMNANTGNAASGITGTFSKMGKGIAIGVMAGVAAMGALAAGALKVGMQFDSAYDTIINRTGATGERLTQLKADANAVFRAMPTEIGIAADAVAILNQRLDLTGTAAQDVAKQLLMTGTGNIAGTTEELSKAMKAWGIETADAAITLDKMKMVSQKTGVPMEKLLGTMSLAAPTMKALGISGDQAIAMMGQLDKAGIEPTIMLTGLRSAMMKFTSAGVTDMAGGLTTLIASIRGATSESAAMSIGMEKFGARAGPMMVQAIRTGAMSTDDLVKAMQNAKGTIESTYMATLDFPEKMMVMKNKVLSAIAPIGESMMGYIGGAFDLLGPYVDRLAVRIATDLVPALDGLVGKLSTLYNDSKTGLAQLAGVLKDVGAFFTVAFGGKVPTMVQTFADGMSQVVPSTAKVVVVALKLRDALYGVGDALQSVRDWLGQLAEGLGIEDRIRGLTSQLTGLWDTVRSSFQSGAKGGGVEGGIESLLGLLGLNVDLAGAAGPIGKLADTLWGQVQSAFQGVKQGDVMGAATLPMKIRDTILAGLPSIAAGLSTQLGTMFPDLKPFLDTWIAPIITIATQIINTFLTIKTQVSGALLTAFGQTDVMGLFSTILGTIGNLVTLLMPPLLSLATAVIPLIAAAFAAVVPIVEKVIEVVGKIIADVLPVAIKIIEKVTSIITENMPLIQSAVETALDVISLIWDKVWAFVKDTLEKVMLVLGPIIEGGLKAINGFLTVFKGMFTNDWDMIWKGVQGILDGAWTTIKGVFTALFGDMIKVAKDKMEAIRISIAEKVEPILKPFKDIWDWIDKNLLPVFRALAALVSAVVGKAFEIIAATFTNKVLPALKDVHKQIANFLQPAFDAIGKVIKDVGGWVTDKLIEPFKALFTKTTEATKATSGFKDLMDKLKGGLDGIGAALSKVTGFFGGLTKKVNEFEVPDQLLDNSPPPLEVGMLGIASAVNLATKAFGGLNRGLGNFEVPEQITSKSPTPLEMGLLGIAEAVSVVSKAFTKMANDMDMGEADVFTEVTKSISRVIDSMRELIILTTTMGGGGPTALPDMTTFMTSYGGFVKAVETVMTGLERELGYERIKQLAKLSMRFQEIFAALNIGDFQIKLFDTSLVTQWSAGLGVLARALIGVLVSLNDPALSKDVQTAEKMSPRIQTIVGFVQGAIDAITALAEFTNVGSLTASIANLHDRLIEIVPQLVDVAKKISTSDLEVIATILTSAQTIVGFVQPAIEALTALAKYETKGSRSVANGIDLLAQDILEVVDGLVYASVGMTEDGNKAAGTIYDAAIGMVNFITPAIDALTALADYKTKGSRSVNEAIDALAQDVLEVVGGLVYAAKGMAEDGNKAASAIYTAAQGMVGFISPAITALTALADYKTKGERSVSDTIDLLAQDVLAAVDGLIYAARGMTEDGNKAASAVYAAAQGMIGFIAPAITALTALFDYVSSDTLAESVRLFNLDMLYVIGWMKSAAQTAETEGYAAASAFYAASKGMIDFIAPAVSGLTALFTYTASDTLAEVTRQFNLDMLYVIGWLKAAAQTTETDGYAAASAFYAACQGMIGFISPAVAGIKAIMEYEPAESMAAAVYRFIVDAAALVKGLVIASSLFAGEGNVAAAAIYAETGGIIGMVAPSVAALKALLDYKSGDVGKAAAKFEADMGIMVEAIARLAAKFTGTGVTAANDMQTSMTAMKTAIESGLGAVTGLSAISVPGNVLSTVSEFAKTVVHYLGFMERTVRGQIANLVQSFTSARSPVITALEAMTKAVSAFGLAMDKLSIPTWLEPGSPPPLAYAMADVRKEVRMLETAYRHIPALESAAGRYAGSRSQTNVTNRSTNLGGIVIQATVNNEVDVQRLGDIVVQRVARAMAM